MKKPCIMCGNLADEFSLEIDQWTCPVCGTSLEDESNPTIECLDCEVKSLSLDDGKCDNCGGETDNDEMETRRYQYDYTIRYRTWSEFDVLIDEEDRLCCDQPKELCECGEKALPTFPHAIQLLSEKLDIEAYLDNGEIYYSPPSGPLSTLDCRRCIYYANAACLPFREWLKHLYITDAMDHHIEKCSLFTDAETYFESP